MSSNKFEEAYCSIVDQVEDIETVRRVFLKDKKMFVSRYKHEFYCPECQRAKLIFVNAESPYFRTCPKSNHSDDCSLKQDVMPLSRTKKYIENRENRDAIQRQLGSVLTMLLTATPLAKKASSTFPIHNNLRSKNSITTRPVLNLRLPRKRIDTPFHDGDFDCGKLFYGKVDLIWERDDKKGGYKMLLYRLDNHQLVCRLYVSQNVYRHLSVSYTYESHFRCAVAFATTFASQWNIVDGQIKTYHKGNLQDSRNIVLEKLKG